MSKEYEPFNMSQIWAKREAPSRVQDNFDVAWEKIKAELSINADLPKTHYNETANLAEKRLAELLELQRQENQGERLVETAKEQLRVIYENMGDERIRPIMEKRTQAMLEEIKVLHAEEGHYKPMIDLLSKHPAPAEILVENFIHGTREILDRECPIVSPGTGMAAGRA